MRIYYDWEFINDGRTTDGISVGMVDENGDCLYRVVKNDTTISRAVSDTWLRQNVVPHLPIRQTDSTWFWNVSHPGYKNVKTADRVAADVREFVLDRPGSELWSWYGAYDHVVMCQLFGRLVDLPRGFPMYTNDLQQEIRRLGLERRGDLLPKQPGNAHDALADAWHHKQVGDFLVAYEQGDPGAS